MRTSVRPAILSLTQTAINNASAIEVGMVPSANQRLLLSAFQKIGSASIC